jgi:hypothetical protein
MSCFNMHDTASSSYTVGNQSASLHVLPNPSGT